jgi:hypothetical protein
MEKAVYCPTHLFVDIRVSELSGMRSFMQTLLLHRRYIARISFRPRTTISASGPA